MRPSVALLALIPVGAALGWALRSDPVPTRSPRPGATPVAAGTPAAARCPELPVAAQDAPPPAPGSVPPPAWDALADERRLWDEAGAFARELGGDALLVDCARWPCVAAMAVPNERELDHADLVARAGERWPGATVKQEASFWQIEDSTWDIYAVTLHAEPLSEEVKRELKLRGLARALEVEVALPAWVASRPPTAAQ